MHTIPYETWVMRPTLSDFEMHSNASESALKPKMRSGASGFETYPLPSNASIEA